MIDPHRNPTPRKWIMCILLARSQSQTDVRKNNHCGRQKINLSATRRWDSSVRVFSCRV